MSVNELDVEHIGVSMSEFCHSVYLVWLLHMA